MAPFLDSLRVQEKGRIRAVVEGEVEGVHCSRDFNEKYKDSPGEEVQTEYRNHKAVTIEVVRIHSKHHFVDVVFY